MTAAYTLERETDFDITLFESGTEFGGKIQTLHQDGFTIEEGPDSIFTAKPAALELISQLGLDDQVVATKSKGYYLLLDGRLHRVPSGLASLINVDRSSIQQADFLSTEGKERALAEPTVPPEIVKDESIAGFFTRRFGYEFSKLVAEPILAGTHGGDPSRLSMRALYPHFLEREAQYGNLSFSDGASQGLRKPGFVSLKTGMKALIEKLVDSLERSQLFLAAGPVRFEGEEASLAVWKDEDPFKEHFDHALLAMPADDASHRLLDIQPETSQLLADIEFASSVIVTAAYEADALPGELNGTGFLAPFDEDEILTGCTWTSAKWPGRAPEDKVLIRFFYGGDGRPTPPTGGELVEATRAHAAAILGIKDPPQLIKEVAWHRALPQYTIGHTELVDRIEESLEGTRFTVAGSSYRGVGIPDCIRQGQDAARKIAKELG